jgi:hypothetical protein
MQDVPDLAPRDGVPPAGGSARAQLKVRRHAAAGQSQQHPRAGTVRSDGVNPVSQQHDTSQLPEWHHRDRYFMTRDEPPFGSSYDAWCA